MYNSIFNADDPFVKPFSITEIDGSAIIPLGDEDTAGHTASDTVKVNGGDLPNTDEAGPKWQNGHHIDSLPTQPPLSDNHNPPSAPPVDGPGKERSDEEYADSSETPTARAYDDPPPGDPPPNDPPGGTLGDQVPNEPTSAGLPAVYTDISEFCSYLPNHDYLHKPTLKHWPLKSVDISTPAQALLDEDGDESLDAQGNPRKMPATAWLDRFQPIHDKTWTPGEPELIRDRVIQDGGWFQHKGARIYNMYRPPIIGAGDPKDVDLFLEHVAYLYPDTCEYIWDWQAHRVLHPGDKVNHALCLLGPMRIGKDLILDTTAYAVGRHNTQYIMPSAIVAQKFNSFMQSVLLVISEAKEKDVDRFQLHNCTKTIIAAPPHATRINPKYAPQYIIPNVCGVAIMSNYKVGGLYLPADDGRHHVSWSDKKRDQGKLTDEYFFKLWSWLKDQGGYDNVAAFLRERDISKFDAKSPPPKTQAFWDIVGTAVAPEDGELADAIDALNNPNALILAQVRDKIHVSGSLWDVFNDKKNARKIPHKMSEVGYTAVRNPDPKAYKGFWTINKVRQVVYAKDGLSDNERIDAVKALLKEPPKPKWEGAADTVVNIDSHRKPKTGENT